MAEPRLEPLAVADAMTQIIRQIIHFNPSGSSVYERVHAITGLRTIVRNRPAWRLVYPSDYAALPHVEALLRPLMAQQADARAIHGVATCR